MIQYGIITPEQFNSNGDITMYLYTSYTPNSTSSFANYSVFIGSGAGNGCFYHYNDRLPGNFEIKPYKLKAYNGQSGINVVTEKVTAVPSNASDEDNRTNGSWMTIGEK